jgi:hypothetical protein
MWGHRCHVGVGVVVLVALGTLAVIYFLSIKKGPPDLMGAELLDAIVDGNTDRVHMLLAEGANPNACTKGGTSAITVAEKSPRREIIQLLVQAGARRKGETEHLDSRPFLTYVLSQEWIGVPKGAHLKSGNDEGEASYDMAFLRLVICVRNPSSEPITVTNYYCLRDRLGHDVGRRSQFFREGFSETEELNGFYELGAGRTRVFTIMTDLAERYEALKENEPLFVHQLGWDGHRTIPEANITITRWEAITMPDNNELYGRWRH